MERFLSIASAVLNGILSIVSAVLSGVVRIISDSPKASAIIAGVFGFMYALHNVPGFGELAARITAVFLILGALGVFKKKKKK